MSTRLEKPVPSAPMVPAPGRVSASRADAAAVFDAIEAYEARYGMYPSSLSIVSLPAHAAEEVLMSCGEVSIE